MVSLGGAPLGHPEALSGMCAALRHRGPDGRGRWCSPSAALGATRLRVVDLDAKADQPFTDPAGNVTVVVNGEIYNAADLRRRYAGFPFRSRSDAECVLPLYLDGGPDALAALDGMFAVAVWDGRDGRLILARDRAGEKPLFYWRGGDELHFASEIGALLANAQITRRLDAEAIRQYVLRGYVPQPRTPFAEVFQVPAGCILSAQADGVTIRRYWRPETLPIRPGPPDIPHLRRVIATAVEKQLLSDVPIGVFTSGGLDSAILACLAARRLGHDRTHTFSIGFPERAYDERPFARRLAKAIGVRHTSIEADPEALLRALDDLVALGEPLGDPAAMPTVLLARAARKHVTVVLSGEGGDELFGGYPTYIGHHLAARYRALPRIVRAGIRAALSAVPSSTGRVPFEYLAKRFVAEAERPWQQRHRAWFGSGLPTSVCTFAALVCPDSEQIPEISGIDDIGRAMRLDYVTALRDRLLVKVDRATMLASLEARAPYLDEAVTRAALAIPGTVHVRGSATKRVLREVARPWVPSFILRRRKRGLSVPISRWINGGLAREVDRALDRERLDAQGICDGRVVTRLLAEHRARRANHSRGLWTIFVLQRWMEHWRLGVM